MNDRFLSRGKLKADNLPHKKGDWVFGYFVILKDGDRDIPYIYGFGEVYPATVGQFTGLTDKSGKKIFEGDIIKTKKYGKSVGHTNFNDYDIFEVKYVPARFVLENHNRRFLLEDDGYSKFEVIGNIYDNKQMLIRADMLDSNDVFQPVFQPVLKSATPENFELMQG